MDKVQERRRSGVSDAYELSITGKNGKLLWVLISGAPIYDDYGKVTGSVGIHHDITLQKQEACLCRMVPRCLHSNPVQQAAP